MRANGMAVYKSTDTNLRQLRGRGASGLWPGHSNGEASRQVNDRDGRATNVASAGYNSETMTDIYIQRRVDLHSLYEWIDGGCNMAPEQLGECLSVEGLSYSDIPNEHYETLKLFRKRSQKGRLASIRKWRKGRVCEVDSVEHAIATALGVGDE